MSYILDALRKSDQQRQRGTAPTLLTAQATQVAPKQPAFSLNGWLAAVLVVAGIVIGWLRPWQTEPPAPATEPRAVQSLAPHPAVLAPHSVASDTTGKSEPEQPARAAPYTAQPALASESAAREPEPTAVARSQTHATLPDAATGIPQEAAAPAPGSPVGTGQAEAGREDKVVSLSELPASIRQEIPSISISFHVYSSNPEARRVMINNELLRQGESLSTGLGVEQITPDGVVISYKGYRFRRGVR